MKEINRTTSPSEMTKNLIAAGVAGAMLGAAFGVGFGSLLLGLPVGILFGLAVGYRISVSPPRMRYPAAMTRWMLLAGSLFLATVMGYVQLLDLGWTGRRAVLAALAPVLAWALLVFVLAAAIASLDELQRRIQTEAIAIGFAGTAVVTLGYGLLGFAGVVQLNWGYVVLVMVVMWLAGKLWTLWRYR